MVFVAAWLERRVAMSVVMDEALRAVGDAKNLGEFIKSPRGRLIPPASAVGRAARSLPSIVRTLCLW